MQRNVVILHDREAGWNSVRAAIRERDDVRVFGDVETRDAAFHLAAAQTVDVLLASSRLEGASSYPTLAELRAGPCRESLLALFVDDLKPEELERFSQLDLIACCRWDELRAPWTIRRTVDAILTGALLIATPAIARDYIATVRGATGDTRDPVELSALDREILNLLARGLSAEEIGDRVSRERSTIRNRLYQLRVRLGASNGPHLVHIAHRMGLIDPFDDEPLVRR